MTFDATTKAIPFDHDAWTAKVRNGPPPKTGDYVTQLPPDDYDEPDDCIDERDGREPDDCPKCGGSGQYDDCTPCSYCGGEGIAPWEW